MEEKKKSEIDIIHLVAIVLKQKKIMARFALAGAVIGIIVGFGTPKEYSSNVILAPEFSSGAAGLSNSLSDLASSFGFDIGSNNGSMDAIYPDIYPDIFESTEFIQSLYDVPVRLDKDTTTRKYLYHKKRESKIPFWKYPMLWVAKLMKPKEVAPNGGNGSKNSYAMSRDDWDAYNSIASSINCIIDKKTSIISISVTDQDPMVAAIIADTLQLRLQKYITDYRTNKSRRDVEHYRQLATQAWEAYTNVRQQYVALSDANFNATLKAVMAKTEDLENDMQLKYSIYTQSMGQLKLAEAKLQERTPAFTIIQSAKVNPKPISRSKIANLFIWLFLSLMVGAGVVWYREMKKEHNKSQLNETV